MTWVVVAGQMDGLFVNGRSDNAFDTAHLRPVNSDFNTLGGYFSRSRTWLPLPKSNQWFLEGVKNRQQFPAYTFPQLLNGRRFSQHEWVAEEH